jgi:hypothetical protein
LFDQTDDRFQSALVRNRKGGVDAKAELSEADDVSEIEIFEWAVVGNVEKDRLNSF